VRIHLKANLLTTTFQDGVKGMDLIVEPLKCHAWPAVDFAFGLPPLADGEECGEDAAVTLAMKGLRRQVDWIVEKLRR
jgi:hypothetical protein